MKTQVADVQNWQPEDIGAGLNENNGKDVTGDDIAPGREDRQQESTGTVENMTRLKNMTRFIVLFILKTNEENQLSQEVVGTIMNNAEKLVEQSLDVFKNNVTTCLTNNRIDIKNIKGLADVLEQPSLFSRARCTIATEYLQVKYFVEHFNFVVCTLVKYV